MIVQMYMQIPIEKLSRYKTVLIPAILNELEIGQVNNILKETQEGVFFCDVYVYPKHENYVLEAMDTEKQRMKS